MVCGNDPLENAKTAMEIEKAAVGAGGVKRDKAHVFTARPEALPHYQPRTRPPEGHTFFETLMRKAYL